MKAIVTLDRTKEGIPNRLRLSCSREYKDKAKLVGCGTGRWQPGTKTWTYPVDPVIVRNILHYFDKIEIEPQLEDYMNFMYDHQQEVIASTEDRSELGAPLWGFQRGSVRFLTKAERCVLGHSPGTGKTPICSVALDYVNARKVILVCPNSVKWSWVDHLTEWSQLQPIYVMESGKKKIKDNRASILQGSGGDRDILLAELLSSHREFVLIINYDQLRIHHRVLAEYDYDVFIADEAHRLSNRQRQRTQAAMNLTKRANYLWLATGTPVRNRYDDLYTLLAMCDPIRFSGYWNFVNLHLDYVPGVFGGIDIIGVRDPQSFNAMLSTYMYRKTKEEVMPDLPSKIYSTLRLKLEPKQEKLYREMEKEFVVILQRELESADGDSLEEKLKLSPKIITAPNVVSQLIRLRQLCLTPAILGGPEDSGKLNALEELLEDLRDSGEQVIIYSCFRKFLVFIEQKLKKLGVNYDTIVGGQSSQERQAVVDKLDNHELQAITGTIHSMGEGMNLQKATTAIFTDIDWVPAVNLQAEDRIHRGEIKKSPTIITLYHPGTVEADMRAALGRKEKIIGEVSGQVETVRQMLLRGGE